MIYLSIYLSIYHRLQNGRSLAFPLFAVLLFAALPASSSDSSESMSFIESLDSRLFGRNELRECERIARKAKSPSEKAEFSAVIARYHCELEKNPLEALKLLQDLLSPEKSSSKSSKSAEIPLSSKTLPFKSPELAPSVIEAGRAFLYSGRDIEAVEVAERSFQTYSGMPKILSAELSSDATLKAKLYARSVEWLELALKMLESARYDKSADEKTAGIVAKRLNSKLEAAQRLRDMDECGEGFVHYRDAEIARLVKKSPIEAIILFEDLIRLHPESVYSEAAKAYTIKCLFELEKPDSVKNARDTLASFAKTIEDRKSMLKKSKTLGVPDAVLNEIESETSALEETVKRMKSVPLGDKSAKLADEKADSFLSENEYGLYRGEILVLLAERAFWIDLDPSPAERAFVRAWKWLENVGRLEDRLRVFSVPDKAFAVSAPPSVESETDFWGNSSKKEIRPGMIVNRRTCPWYLADLREQCLLPLGFLYFYNGKKEKALECFNEVLKYDEETRRLEDSGEWNNCTRLKWGAENGYLNAYPAELELYRDRQKFVVLVADYYFCIMDFGKSANLAKRLLAGEFGKLDSRQDDYPKFLLASCSYWSKDRKEAFMTCREILDDKAWTITKDRAALVAANIGMQSSDEGIFSQAYDILLKLADSGRNTPSSERARFSLGVKCLQMGELDEAEKWLGKIQETKDFKSGYHLLARQYLNTLNDMKNKNNKNSKEGAK